MKIFCLKKRAHYLHAIKGYHTLYTPTSKHTQMYSPNGVSYLFKINVVVSIAIRYISLQI